eukprot:TRINITY_DN4112_c0_g1_i3.p1 TRINITY_DN4112_c0_g1~~TRINITY_DN4112_c0_g1_i3.p1  ORF type:complete len:270 (-),score=80.41 TRINITY_DN4112_c0_g1_i3:70-879(-)
MGIEPPVYLLNPMGPYRPTGRHGSVRVPASQVHGLWDHKPGGRTPLTEAVAAVLQEHKDEAGDRPLFLLILTDGEGNHMDSFNMLLDSVQWGAHGDVQVCLNGLSLVPEDLEWFENEECDDTRIRTVEAFEAEQQQMLRREVIGTEGDYNFDMHVYRTLLTNFFPMDYDFEAPSQNCRHRCYVTCHGRDRWLNQSCCACGTTYKDLLDNSDGYCPCGCGLYCCVSTLCGALLCTPAYCLSGRCCCGYCQGQECCKPRPTQLLDTVTFCE